MLRLFVAYQVVGDCGVPGDQIGRSRLETGSSLKDAVGSVQKSEGIGCCRVIEVVRERLMIWIDGGWSSKSSGGISRG